MPRPPNVLEKTHSRDHTGLADALIFAVRDYLDGIIAQCTYRNSGRVLPILANAIATDCGEHFVWRNTNGNSFVPANLSCQQQLLRTLDGYSRITGDEKYVAFGRAVAAFWLKNFTDQNGLIFWGSHAMVDLRTLHITGPTDKSLCHELKNVFPDYSFLYSVAPASTLRFIRAFWSAHVSGSGTLDISRHGKFNDSYHEPWCVRHLPGASFREANTLTFVSTANDLAFAAISYALLTGDRMAGLKARDLVREFINARDPDTGLGSYQYTRPRQLEAAKTDVLTHSKFGDRAFRQFGPEFGEAAFEGKMLTEREGVPLYGVTPLLYFHLANVLDKEGAEYAKWACEGLASFARYAFCPDTCSFRPIMCNGASLDGYELRRSGYYGPKGTRLGRYPAQRFFLSYVRAALFSGQLALWNIAREIASGEGLGDIGCEPGLQVRMHENHSCRDGTVLLALLEIYTHVHVKSYLSGAISVAHNILRNRQRGCWFASSTHPKYLSTDTVEPLALLNLAFVCQNRGASQIHYFGGNGSVHGGYLCDRTGIVCDARDKELYQ